MTIIHQAIFGDKEDGFGLLSATCSGEIARKITGQTDMYEQTPDGVNWDYALRGFAYADHYLLMRTYLDRSKNVRAGRVYSHCLIIPIGEIEKLNALSDLISFLPSDISKNAVLKPIEYTPATHHKWPVVSGRINYLVNKLVNDHVDFFAWIEYDGYEAAIQTLWDNISPSIRKHLHFGIGFSPNEWKNRPGIKVLSIPGRLASKWIGEDIVTINLGDNIEPTTELERLLLGEKEGNPIFELISSSGIEIKSIDEYLPLQKVLKTLQNLKGSDINSLLTLLNTLAIYHGGRTNNQPLRNEIGIKIGSLLKNGTVDDLIRVRNEDFSNLISEQASSAISKIISTRLIDIKEPLDVSLAKLIPHLEKRSILPWWKDGVSKALATIFMDWKEKFTTVILNLINSENGLNIEIIDSLVPQGVQEISFIESLKRHPAFKAYPTILDWATMRNWLSLYALSLTKTEKIGAALKKQLKIDPEPKNRAALQLITDSYSASELVKAAREIKNGYVNRCLAARCSKQRDMMKVVDPKDMFWQEILLLMSSDGWNFWADKAMGSRMLFALLDCQIIETNPLIQDLLERISAGTDADLYQYPARSKAWSCLPKKTRDNLLGNTATTVIEIEGLEGYSALEPELQRAIREPSIIDSFVNKNRLSLSKVLPILGKLILDDRYVRDYISYYTAPITVTESTLLGKIIMGNHWKLSAQEVYSKSTRIPSFKEALAECHSLLGFFDRLSLSINNSLKVNITEADWWTALLEIAIELFPEGPKQKKIWEEANGKIQDLDLNGSGREQWRSALNQLRNGSATVTKKNLLNAMLEEYSNNPHLLLLKKWLKN